MNGGAIVNFAYNHFDLLVFSFPLLQQLAENFTRTWLGMCACRGRKRCSLIEKEILFFEEVDVLMKVQRLLYVVKED